MTLEHTIREPYAAHVRELQAQIGKLRAERAQALATAFEAGQTLQFLERHLQTMIELEIKAVDLPNPTESYMIVDGKIRWEAPDNGKL